LSGLQKYSLRLINTKASMPKFQVQNMALFSAFKSENYEDARLEPKLWGRAVESAVGCYLVNECRRQSNSELYYWREGSVEIDFLVKLGGKLLAIEVKSNPLAGAGKGLSIFKEKFPAARTLLVGGVGLSLETFFSTPLEALFTH
jgi:predicted AAA+ superfamily ATPase